MFKDFANTVPKLRQVKKDPPIRNIIRYKRISFLSLKRTRKSISFLKFFFLFFSEFRPKITKKDKNAKSVVLIKK